MTQPICNKKPYVGLGSCTLDPGHKEDHEDATTGRTWPNHKRKPKSPLLPGSSLKPGRGPKRRSEKKISDDETWAFIKECFMACHPFCVDCGRPSDDTWTLDLDHVVSRARGGKSTPSNACLRCRHRFDRNQGCHPAKHGTPFQKETA